MAIFKVCNFICKVCNFTEKWKGNIYRCFFAFSLFVWGVLSIHLKSCFLERKVTTSTFSHEKLTRDLSRQRFFRTTRSSLPLLCSKLDGCLWKRRIITQLSHQHSINTTLLLHWNFKTTLHILMLFQPTVLAG